MLRTVLLSATLVCALMAAITNVGSGVAVAEEERVHAVRRRAVLGDDVERRAGRGTGAQQNRPEEQAVKFEPERQRRSGRVHVPLLRNVLRRADPSMHE